MTEEQAKTKMCCGPQVVAMVMALNLPKQPELHENAGRCIASACMAWRLNKAVERVEAWDPDGAGWTKVRDSTFDALPLWSRPGVGGYCGLAGALQ